MFVAVNRISAPPEAMDRMTEGFRRNADSLKGFDGFVAFELWRGVTTLEAVSKWTSRAAYDAWANSAAFSAAHGGARRGEGGQGGDQGGSGQGGSGQGGSSVAYYYEAEVMSEG